LIDIVKTDTHFWFGLQIDFGK